VLTPGPCTRTQNPAVGMADAAVNKAAPRAEGCPVPAGAHASQPGLTPLRIKAAHGSRGPKQGYPSMMDLQALPAARTCIPRPRSPRPAAPRRSTGAHHATAVLVCACVG
jgi:hypothetical protein